LQPVEENMGIKSFAFPLVRCARRCLTVIAFGFGLAQWDLGEAQASNIVLPFATLTGGGFIQYETGLNGAVDYPPVTEHLPNYNNFVVGPKPVNAARQYGSLPALGTTMTTTGATATLDFWPSKFSTFLPTLTASASTWALYNANSGFQPVGPVSAQVSAFATYYMYVAGPTNTSVSVDIAAQGWVVGTGTATLNMTPADNPFFQVIPTQSETNTIRSWIYKDVLQLRTDTIYRISMQIGADAASGAYGGGSGTSAIFKSQDSSAFLDPEFTIDPAYSSQYSLIFSDGIGDGFSPAVPEPSTWAMMMIGFAGLGYISSRRRARRIAVLLPK